MKKEQKPEPQQNSDSLADNSQVSPTCPKPIVSRSAIADLVFEAEKRVAKVIKDDIEFGYDLKMIRSKIKTGSYVGSSLETLKTFKKHFC